MEKNIFEGAKFGDKFLTDNNKIANFICATKYTHYTKYCLYVENESSPYWYNKNGILAFNNKLNIVSKYQEPIDEEKLDELATKECWKNMDWYHELYCDGFKAGYRKAIENE